jgi:hypothetical protein
MRLEVVAVPVTARFVVVAYVVVAFVPEKFATFKSVDEAVDWKPL